jgi:hypothetical protein
MKKYLFAHAAVSVAFLALISARKGGARNLGRVIRKNHLHEQWRQEYLLRWR